MIPDIHISKAKFRTIQKDKIYDNIEFYSPDGVLMFLGHRKKAEWYLKRDLIKEIGENKYQFLFTPKALGHFGEHEWQKVKQGISCMPKETICVVSGKNKDLTKHHIVPAAYIKYFLLNDYSNNRMQIHDVVLLHHSVHEEYENKALFLKEKLCKKYDITPFNDSCRMQSKNYSIIKQGRYLTDPEKVASNKYHLKQLMDFCARNNIDSDEIPQLIKQKEEEINSHYKELSEKLVSLEMIQDFCEIWRKHFVDTMKPKHLPQNWSIKTKISPKLC